MPPAMVDRRLTLGREVLAVPDGTRHERVMTKTTQKLLLQGGGILVGALLVSSLGGWAGRPTPADNPPPGPDPGLGERRPPSQEPEAPRGEPPAPSLRP